MKTLLTILLLCATSFCANLNKHDTVFVEQIVRDTVYIPIKPKADTIYIKNTTVAKQLLHAKCCAPTERNPLGEDTTKFLRYDTSYTHHTIYLHFDIVSFFWLMSDSTLTSVGGNLEISGNRKNSFMMNFRYSKKIPWGTSSHIYNGYIAQYDIGIGYRHYFRPSKYSGFIDIGGNWLIRKHDYDNTWDNTNLINDRPHSRHENAYLYSPYIHSGHIFRGDRNVFSIEYGLAYNFTDKELLNKQFAYITGGIQFDFRINFGVGIF